MILESTEMDDAPMARAAPLAAARALLQDPVVLAPSPWPALGSAVIAACAAMLAAASVILCGPALGDPSHTVYVPVSHLTPS